MSRVRAYLVSAAFCLLSLVGPLAARAQAINPGGGGGSSLPLPVSPTNGGTGVSAPSAHTIPITEGATAFSGILLGTGQMIVGQGPSADPLGKTIGGDCTINSSASMTCSKSSALAFGISTQTFATIPACSAATKGDIAYITDGPASPTYMQTVTVGGGSTAMFVGCNSVNWLAI